MLQPAPAAGPWHSQLPSSTAANRQDAESHDSRQTPGSCRNGVTLHLLSANGTPIAVKAAISHHPGSLSQGATWAVAFTRSSDAAADDERRLLLRVKLDGTIVGVSRGTPGSLFGLDPGHLVGGRLEAVVDVCLKWAKAGEQRPGRVCCCISCMQARALAVIQVSCACGGDASLHPARAAPAD